MGKILNVRENNNIVEMTIFDGTGTYTVHYYSNDIDDSVSASKLPCPLLKRCLPQVCVVQFVETLLARAHR